MENISVPPMIPLSKLKEMKQTPPVTPAASPSHSERKYKLLCVDGIYAEAVFPLDGRIILGRDVREANIVYPADAVGVSRTHCCVWVDREGQVLIKDLGSSNGTFFADGTRLEPNVTYRVNLGECFYLGSKRETYKLI